MPRSLKKGPFVDDHLLKKVDVLNSSGRQEGHQDLVPSFHDHPRHGRAHHRRPRRPQVTSRSTSPSRWSATSWASSRRPGPSATTPARSGGSLTMTATKTNERPGTRAVHRHSGMSASKARQVLDLIRGQDVQTAAEILTGTRPRGRRDHRQGPGLGRGQRRPQRPAEPRGALRLGLLRRRGRHHEALASPGPWPGHQDPQADLPHHHHREPAARRQARAAPPPHGGGQRQPVPPGRRLAAPGRPVRPAVAAPGQPGGDERLRRKQQPRPPRRTRTSPTRRRPRPRRTTPRRPRRTRWTGDVSDDDVVEDAAGDGESAAADEDEKGDE